MHSSLPPFFSSFPLTEEMISTFINGEQNCRKGRDIVACRNCMKVTVTYPESQNEVSFTAFVHKEKATEGWYQVGATLTPIGISSSICVCTASQNSHNKCKHVSALLYAVFCMKNVPHQTSEKSLPKWISARKRKTSRYGKPGSKIYQKTKAWIRYNDIYLGFTSDPPREDSGKAVKLVTEFPQKKERKVVKICICQDKKGQKKHRIVCTGCRREYHKACLPRIGRTIQANGEFYCCLHNGCIAPSQGSPQLPPPPLPPTPAPQLTPVDQGTQSADSPLPNPPAQQKRKGKSSSSKKEKKKVNENQPKKKRKMSTHTTSFDLPRKKRRQAIEYPPEIAHLSETAKEEWRVKQIYNSESTRK
jgi:hypothetical protein